MGFRFGQHITYRQLHGDQNMSALYVMRYLGDTGVGVGAIYIGKGTVVGIDAGNGRYTGKYSEAWGRITGTITLVTGTRTQLISDQQVSEPGTQIPMMIDWPT